MTASVGGMVLDHVTIVASVPEPSTLGMIIESVFPWVTAPPRCFGWNLGLRLDGRSDAVFDVEAATVEDVATRVRTIVDTLEADLFAVHGAPVVEYPAGHPDDWPPRS